MATDCGASSGSRASHRASSSAVSTKGFDPARGYEAWRPALVAYYRATGSLQCAENLDTYHFPLCSTDKQRIEGLMAALEALQMAEAA